jgi:hypothetical protein
MTVNHNATEHHTSAAFHHQKAAQFHREASRHYELGKDYAHAAHQALIAHGHGLRAIDQGNAAGKYYAGQDGGLLGKYPEPIPLSPGKALETMDIKLSGSEHHAAAADDHEHAAQHHLQAAKHLDEKDYELAAHEAQIAHRRAHFSIFHDDEAAMHHVEHYGKSGQSAEIV